MSVVLYHHPFTRAASVLWMLEELGIDHEVRFVNLLGGEHKSAEILALNPMGKLPIVVDGEVVVTELAAIGLYLADRYAAGRLAPLPDEPRRATYLRWSLFSPSVIEPGLLAKKAGWTYRESAAGWGNYEAMLTTLETAIGAGPYVLGDDFTMVDIILGGTLRYMLRFGLLEPRATFTAYAERLGARPAWQRADARNTAIAQERGIERA